MKKQINHLLNKVGLHLKRSLGLNVRFFNISDLRNKGFVPSSILDVGAAQGNWTKDCLKVFPEADYLLIEPLKENLASLTALCNRFSNIQFVSAAAGHISGYLSMRIQNDLDGSSFHKDADPRFIGSIRDVAVLKIDDLIKNGRIAVPDLMKLDVQGFELNVLEGANSALGNTEVVILEISLYKFLEGAPIFHDVISYMHKHDYVLYDIMTVMRRPFDNALAQMDAVFVLEHSRLRQSNRWYA